MIVRESELYHWGVKKQKWGVRRWQNEDGSLTPAGREHYGVGKRVASDKKAVIAKGSTLYRVSMHNKSDVGTDKLYVSTSKDEHEFFIKDLGADRLAYNGKIFAHEYTAKKDIILPDKKTTIAIEKALLKNKNVKREVYEKQAERKGMTPRQYEMYSVVSSIAQGILMSSSGAVGSAAGGAVAGLAVGGLAGAGVGAIAGGVSGAVAGAIGAKKAATKEDIRDMRNIYGNKDAKVLNEALRKETLSRGYNGMKDYNDRAAYGKDGRNAIIIFNSRDNAKLSKKTGIKAQEYGDAYARDYMRKHPNSKKDYSELVLEGKDLYEEQMQRYEERKSKR